MSVPGDTNLSILLSETSQKMPERIFIRYEGKQITYNELNTAATSIALTLKKEGLAPGERVAILSHNCPEFVAGYFGILRGSGSVVPVNALLKQEEVAYVLQDSSAGMVLYGSRFTPMIESLSDLFKAVKFIPLEDAANRPPYTDSAPVPERRPEDTAAILYTSGTTGRPKGAMLTHRNIGANALAAASALGITRKDRFMTFLPLAHAFALTVCVVIPMIRGASTTLIPSINPVHKLLKTLVTDKITIFVAIPGAYSIFSSMTIPSSTILLLSLRFCVSGAAPLSAATIEAFEKSFGVPLIQGYGLTETSPIISVDIPGRQRPGSVGTPLPETVVRVVDKDGVELPVDVPGELIVKGPNVMRGYLNREKETADTIKNGWLHTGDIATIDRDGYIRIVDREKDMIIVDGFNIYPSEVESVLCAHPDIKECAMVGIHPSEHKEIPVMFVLKEDGVSLTGKDVREFLAGRIAKYKMPKKIEFVDEFPRNQMGKILKKALRTERV